MQHPDLAPTASDAHPGCALCALRARSSPWNPRRGFLRVAAAAATAGAALPALAQVDVGNASQMRMLVPADTLEKSAQQQYGQMLAEAVLMRDVLRTAPDEQLLMTSDDLPMTQELPVIAPPD